MKGRGSRGGQFLGRREEKPEKREQRWVIDCFKKAGMRVYSLSQPRATMQSEGLPDLWVFCPRKKVGFWWETKAPKGQMSPAQRVFRDLCLVTDTPHYVGGLEHARRLLEELGLTWAPIPRELPA